MKVGIFDRAHVNADLLHEQLKTALGDKYISMDTGDGKVTVRLQDNATPEDQTTIDALITNHDPAGLSTGQLRQKARSEAFLRLQGLNIAQVRGKSPNDAINDILDILVDIQAMLRASNG